MLRQLKFLPLLLLLIAACLPLSAEEDPMAPFGKLPHRILKAECAKIKSSSSPCNTGAEPFSTFLKKFKSSKSFCKSRLKIEAQYGNEEYMINTAEFLPETLIEFKFPIFQRKTRCEDGYGTWYNVQKDVVYYCYSSEVLCDEGGGSCFYFVFRRINGKWYLTNTLMAG